MDNVILRPESPGMKIMAPPPRYGTYVTVTAPTIMDTNEKDAYSAVNQVVNNDTVDITILVKSMTCMKKIGLRPAEVLER